MEITKEWLNEKGACSEGVEWFSHSSHSEPLIVLKNLISEDHLDWANWLIVRVMDRMRYLRYAIYAARQVLDIFEKKYPADNRPRKAIEAAIAVLDNDTAETRKTAAAYAADAYAADAARRQANMRMCQIVREHISLQEITEATS